MQQYFAKNKALELEDSDYHHIKNVMRMKKGDLIKVIYDNTCYDCKLTNVNNKSSFEVLSQNKRIEKSYSITVAFSLIKEQKLNYLLQKTTEVGVDYLIPLQTKRSVVKIESKKELSKIDRWQKICKEAAEQSFRYNTPKINNVLTLKELVNKDYDLKLLCSLNENTKSIKKVLEKTKTYDKILIVVGPEGGFEPIEENYLLENGFISVSLGSNVLRAETAPVVALSIINYEFGR